MPLTATIVKERHNGLIHIRISSKGPQTGGDVDVIEILQLKDNESETEFKERAIDFVNECVD